jgi:hypothetical protein
VTVPSPHKRLTSKQVRALELLQTSRLMGDTWTGALYPHETFLDGEIGVAYINFHTAEALRRRGLIEYGERDPEWGTEIVLVTS